MARTRIVSLALAPFVVALALTSRPANAQVEYDQYGYAQDADPSALVQFRTALDPFGTWLDDPTYGTVWVPSVDAGFQPYVTNGHWTYANGWSWVSDYPWGWAPFHYGRWVLIQGVGWAWVPGRAYAGAWVDWRVGDGYVGWSPLPPTWAWRDGVAVSLGYVPPSSYAFCPYGSILAPRVQPYVVVGGPSSTWYARSRPYVQQAPPAYAYPRSYGTTTAPPARAIARPSVAAPAPAVPIVRPAAPIAHPPAMTLPQPQRATPIVTPRIVAPQAAPPAPHLIVRPPRVH